MPYSFIHKLANRALHMSLYTENQYIYRAFPRKIHGGKLLLMLVSCLYALADSRDALLVYPQVGEQSITYVIVHWESVYIYRPSPGKYTVASFLLMLVSCLYALADSRDALLVYPQVGEQSITYVIVHWESVYIYRPSPGKYTVASFLLMLVSCLYALADSRDALLVYPQVGEQSITYVIVHWESVYIYRPSPGKYTVASFLLMLVSCLYALADSRDALLVYAQVGEQSITHVIVHWESVYIYRPSPGKYTVASFLLMLVSCLYALADSRDALLVYAQVGEQSITYVIVHWESVYIYRPSQENTRWQAFCSC